MSFQIKVPDKNRRQIKVEGAGLVKSGAYNDHLFVENNHDYHFI